MTLSIFLVGEPAPKKKAISKINHTALLNGLSVEGTMFGPLTPATFLSAKYLTQLLSQFFSNSQSSSLKATRSPEEALKPTFRPATTIFLLLSTTLAPRDKAISFV